VSKRKVSSFGFVVGVILIITLLVYFFGPQRVSVANTAPTRDRPEGQLVLRFSRPMRQEGFAESWSLEPDIPGQLEWQGSALYFTPEQTLPSGKNMNIRIRGSARDIFGKPLGKDLVTAFQLTSPSFVYLDADGQLARGTLSGEVKILTKDKTIRQFAVDGKNGVVWYLNQPTNASSTELWRVELSSGFEERFLADKNFQIRSFSVARQGSELILLTQPILARTNEGLSVYRFSVLEKTLQQIELGELGLTLSDLRISGDGETMVIKTLGEDQYLRKIDETRVQTIEEISQYRGSDRFGSLLVFEHFNHDKNFAGEVVLYDSETQLVTNEEATLLMPSLSADGKNLAYSFQLRSGFSEQSVQAGQALQVLFTLPVSGVRRQSLTDFHIEWEYFNPEMSFELPQFSPDGEIVSVEVFTKEELQDLRNIREYGEPNKPSLGKLRFFDRAGKLLPQEFVGRELQWVDAPRTVIIE
jgi:hypothetical protein